MEKKQTSNIERLRTQSFSKWCSGVVFLTMGALFLGLFSTPHLATAQHGDRKERPLIKVGKQYFTIQSIKGAEKIDKASVGSGEEFAPTIKLRTDAGNFLLTGKDGDALERWLDQQAIDLNAERNRGK